MFNLSSKIIKTPLTRGFRTSAPSFVKVGDKIPTIPLTFEKPGNNYDLAQETSNGKSIVVGVPGAFSGGCTFTHIPGYLEKLNDFKQKGFNKIYFVAVNDAFVMDAWSKSILGETPPAEVKFLADPKGEFIDALDLKFDASAFFGNGRSKRFAIVVEDGIVKKTFIEPENTPVDVSAASNVLSSI